MVLVWTAAPPTSRTNETTAGMALAPAAPRRLRRGDQGQTSISDIVRVPFGYLLDWLYRFANNYGVALILFSLIVKLVLLPLSIKSKKSMLKMSRLLPRRSRRSRTKYGDDTPESPDGGAADV